MFGRCVVVFVCYNDLFVDQFQLICENTLSLACIVRSILTQAVTANTDGTTITVSILFGALRAGQFCKSVKNLIFLFSK